MPRISPNLVLSFLLVSFSMPALAIYKCESAGAVTYSEAPCPGGKLMDIDNKPSEGDAAKSAQQTAKDKKELARLESARHKSEAAEEKVKRQAARAAAARERKCASLAQRKKWLLEDAAKAAGKAADKAKLKARRMAEKYQLECG
jgi:hypothetical protein